MFRFLYKYIRRNLFIISIVTFLSLSIWLISLLTPYINSMLIDYLAYRKNIRSIYKVIVAIIIMAIFNISFSYISNMLIIKIQSKMSYDINFDLLEHLKKINILDVTKYEPVYLTQRINDDSNNIVSFFINNYLNIFVKFGTIIFSLLMFLIINKSIFYISLVSIPVYFTLYELLKKPLYSRGLSLRESKNIFFKYLSEQLIFLKNIKINATFEENAKCLNNSFLDFFNKTVKLNRISYLFSSLDSVITLFLQVSILFFGVKSVINESMTIGQFTVIMSYYAMLIGSFKYYLNLGKLYQDFRVSYYRVKELWDIRAEKNGELYICPIKKIEMENIGFSFSDEDISYVFLDFNYTFNKNNIYILKGDNGSGKSTLIDILVGLFNERVKGKVYYNNIPIKDLDIYKLRREKISVVEQEPIFPNRIVSHLFDKSLSLLEKDLVKKDINEFFFNDKFNLSKLWNKQVSLLSGGEKQKLAILKAIIKNSDVLILDEPTSALDSQSVEYFKRALLSLTNKIIVIITHDSRIYEIADHNINLDEKKQAIY